ncbi:ATP-binding protein [Ktedonosporobacter rubrisoli]|uniref:ATP-binding protein n=1 Tax=Ktedonosporobacter rubrisoli TaxID=2509675 RepID=A0A4P6JKZ5_KTERU|nr:AAA family ATPase [Ktedonosporobacter rubrisoli]QBD75652.1 ATP-binding protein [Ktedonosporobacter rubrisoli]
MGKPVLVIVNGLPGTGKTTLSRRLAADLKLPVFGRDSLYETLYDALEGQANDRQSRLGHASFALLYHVADTILAADKSLIVEGFFGNIELRSAEFLQLQQRTDLAPLQILCHADGELLLERFLARMESSERHGGHQDRKWLEQHKERLLRGQLAPLKLAGQLLEIDTTAPHSSAYAKLLGQVQRVLANGHSL